MIVDITGVDKGALLAEAFNASKVMGMGVFQADRGPEVMTHEYGRELVQMCLNGDFADDKNLTFNTQSGLSFDYLFGRPLKLNLSTDTVDSWGFDRDNGGDGSLQAIVDKLKASK